VRVLRAAAIAAAGATVAAAAAGVAAPAPVHRDAAAPACAAPPAGDRSVAVDPGRVPVLLHVPPGRTTARRGLVLVLPGAAMSGRDMARMTGYSRLADRRGFLVAYPTAAGRRPFWNISARQPGKPDDVAYLSRVIETLTGPAACADPARVGVTGVSNGGGMTALLACRAAGLLAAAAPVAGGYSSLPDCHPERPLPLLEIHGLRDEVVPYQGKPPSGAGAVGPYLSGWLGRDRCSRHAARLWAANRVLELRWRCADGRMVVHDRVYDAEHGWPGGTSLRPFSSTARTWRFLSSFTDD
jgi:polyhydroxybutyrate depolymerase